MNVVDSSAWLEYFSNGPHASFFAKPIEEVGKLIVPSLSLFEVFKRVLQQRDENDALQAVAVMHQGAVIDLDSSLTLNAARLSVDNQLSLADSVILATAREYDATLWTLDADFKGLDKVQYKERNLTSRVIRPGQPPPPDDEWLEYPVEERVAAVWRLTRLCHAWGRKDDGEPRLRRAVSRIQRAGR